MHELFYDCAEKFLKDFQSTMNVETYIRLKILLSRETKPQKIKLYLAKLSTETSYDSVAFKQSDLERVIKSYNKKDNNKICRFLHSFEPTDEEATIVDEESAALNLIKVLRLQSIVNTILTQYPLPSFAGLPYDEWTPIRLRKYLCLYFNIKASKKINRGTLASYIYSWADELKNDNEKKSVSITKNYYKEKSEIFYIYFWVRKLPKSQNSKSKLPRYRRYTRIMYVQLLKLNKDSIDKVGNLVHRRYNASDRRRNFLYSELIDTLASIVKKTQEGDVKKTMFLLDTGMLSFSKVPKLEAENLPAGRVRRVLQKHKKGEYSLAKCPVLITKDLCHLSKNEKALLPDDFDKWEVLEILKKLQRTTTDECPYEENDIKEILSCI